MKRGFTLLEVMIALAIFALAALTVMQVSSGAIRSQSVLQERMVAEWVADNQIALLYLMTNDQRAVSQQGTVEMAGQHWYWRSVPVSTETPLLQATDVDVSLQADFKPVLISQRIWFSAVLVRDRQP